MGSPVLELGCGTARTMLPIAASGLRIVGVDASAQMLAMAARKVQSMLPQALAANIALLCADMRRFRLRCQFRLAILPYRTFQHLLTDEDQVAALHRIREHLHPEGVLAFNVFAPGPDILAESDELERDTVFPHPETGDPIEVWYRRSHDARSRCLRQEFVYRSSAGTEEHGQLTLRYAAPLEMEELLESTGFRIQALCGDFDGNPFDGLGEQVWIARRE